MPQEKPLVRDYWINAGFFVFEKRALFEWGGPNLERDVLPKFAKQGKLHVHKHDGFWKSMDTSKDQQELEALCADKHLPWMQVPNSAHGAQTSVALGAPTVPAV